MEEYTKNSEAADETVDETVDETTELLQKIKQRQGGGAHVIRDGKAQALGDEVYDERVRVSPTPRCVPQTPVT